MTTSPNLCSSHIFWPFCTLSDLSNVRVYSSRACIQHGTNNKTATVRERPDRDSLLVFRVMAQYVAQRLLFLAVQIGQSGLQPNIKAIRRSACPRFRNRRIEQRQTLFFVGDLWRRRRR